MLPVLSSHSLAERSDLMLVYQHSFYDRKISVLGILIPFHNLSKLGFCEPSSKENREMCFSGGKGRRRRGIYKKRESGKRRGDKELINAYM